MAKDKPGTRKQVRKMMRPVNRKRERALLKKRFLFPTRTARLPDYVRFVKFCNEFFEYGSAVHDGVLHPEYNSITLKDWSRTLTLGLTPSGERGD